jgi:tRNA (cmo5U34)-methyltransferase
VKESRLEVKASLDQGSRAALLFDQGANEYDGLRRKFIPCFDDFYKTAIDVLPFKKQQPIRVLDLGAGTGLLSSLVIDAFPNAKLTLVDISPEMLKQAGKRRQHLADASLKVLDYAKEPISGDFDAIVSALSIHHLSDEEKRQLFRRIGTALVPGGIFVNADQVLGITPAIEAVYRGTWLRQVRDAGVSDHDLQEAQKRMALDQMASLDDQLSWMREAGFGDVTCWYKNYSFTVFSGRK